MENKNVSVEKLIEELREREKELNCLYNVEEILNTTDIIDDALRKIITVIPAGWKYSDECLVQILYNNQGYHSPDFRSSRWVMYAPIKLEGNTEGEISVYYTREFPQGYEGPFLKEERKLLDNIAERIGNYILHRRSKALIQEWERVKETKRGEWRVVVDLVRKTDRELFIHISRKMLYYLCWNGIPEAQKLLQHLGSTQEVVQIERSEDVNKPSPKIELNMAAIAPKVFEIAASYLNDESILAYVQRWIQESRTNFLLRCLESRETSLAEVADAIRQFHHLSLSSHELPVAMLQSVNVSLISRFFTDQLDFVQIAKNFVDIHDIYTLLKRTIFPLRSHGKLGGKSAGVFLASNVLKKFNHQHELLQQVKVPKTWYITSDGIQSFVDYNHLEEISEQKYKPIERVRMEYPHIIQIFKNSPFPPDILNGLSLALDDLGDNPIIVRSSSLLEDRLGTAFAGKYKSLFLANQGAKQERLEALTDAVAEVYASVFNPDSIEYRAERGLIDFHEEMGIMVQQVVGKRAGKYFLPAYSGVAFTNNEFRWSPRIRREDGLIRLVPGLGTRAVDRVADDYPVLIAPGQANLRVNVSMEEYVRYAPKRVDVINLETNTFETVEFDDLIRECGDQFPAVKQVVSIINGDQLSKPGWMTDFSKEKAIVSFEGLRMETEFVDQIRIILNTLAEHFQTPVDLEFSSDGEHLYLLQCRPQSFFQQNEACVIPDDIPEEKIIFSANKFVSNGNVTNITHIVYVDDEAYNNLEEQSELFDVGLAVGKLNTLLPKRQFILMGPGRWGSRGDIKLGVHVTYADINNTAAMIEIAMRKGNYVPELSFGTHFFQDLVEAAIRYLPLYPGTENVVFNAKFLKESPNMLAHLLPKYAWLNHTIKVIDIPKTTGGQVLRLAMNADLDQAVAYLTSARTVSETPIQPDEALGKSSEAHWRWRLRMATCLARSTDPDKFGVKGFYLIGSTKNNTSGPASDIDLLLHVSGTEEQRKALDIWLEAWSASLDEMNYLRTGHRTGGLLHPRFVTDEEIAKKTSFAQKIDAMTDAARKLPMMEK